MESLRIPAGYREAFAVGPREMERSYALGRTSSAPGRNHREIALSKPPEASSLVLWRDQIGVGTNKPDASVQELQISRSSRLAALAKRENLAAGRSVPTERSRHIARFSK